MSDLTKIEVEDFFPTKSIKAHYTTSMYYENELYIKKNLLTQLIDKMTKYKHIEYTKTEVQNIKEPIKYTAEVNIVDKRYGEYPQKVNKYYIGNTEFTDNEIETALKNTFPEKLI